MSFDVGVSVWLRVGVMIVNENDVLMFGWFVMVSLLFIVVMICCVMNRLSLVLLFMVCICWYVWKMLVVVVMLMLMFVLVILNSRCYVLFLCDV